MTYRSGFGFPQDVLFDVDRMKRLFSNKWVFVGTRADVPKVRDYFRFSLFDDEYFLLHGSDGIIRCFVNRCAHQSARLVGEAAGRCSANIICPNHQWVYGLNDGELKQARIMPDGFIERASADGFKLKLLPVHEVSGLLFICLDPTMSPDDLTSIDAVIAPYTDAFKLDQPLYKAAYQSCEVVDLNWLLVMINNRECCHCQMNHKGLLKLFDASSFNGAVTPDYEALFERAKARWDAKGLLWREQAFDPDDNCRIARYPLKEGYKSISFDGQPVCRKTIGPFEGQDFDESTLSLWLNPNAWIHFTSDHIATNWVLPLDAERCVLYTSWIVHAKAVEGEDYTRDHMTEVWNVTNAEDVALCASMGSGVKSESYAPGPFAPDEQFCMQFCDWYMKYSED